MDSISPPRYLSLDLEVGTDDRIRALGAVRADTGRSLMHSGGGLFAALARLDDFAEGASVVLGHNLIAFDLPHLRAAKPDLRLLRLPVVDTLRLSPLAFPCNPYHSLVKHHQDGGLKRGRVNDPELDSRIALHLFGDERTALAKAAPDLLAAWHWLCTPDSTGADRALDECFRQARRARRPSQAEAMAATDRRLENAACTTQAGEVVASAARLGWALAYALAWLSVAGGNSVMPPWVRHQFPEAGQLVRRLRDTACTDPACGWCRERHDAGRELKRWFGYDGFRAEPADADGRPMQQAIVEEGLAGKHVLGILPTGTGRSLCYQIPALSRYDKTGALTVVISPLVALTVGEKFSDILQVLTSHLSPSARGGAIVYCATRQQSEDVAEYLELKEIAADHFHAGLPPETKKEVQRRFIAGELRAIVATNAFGMGIDKPDVRLVVHADIPGSLENYLQEAGRAGRDRDPARCVLLYAADDVERQFGMSARSRLTREEIHGILRAPARNRMKAGHPIRVDRVRESDPPGGAWADLDPVSRGRVQTLPAGGDPVGQARAVMAELLRLCELAQEWDWSRCAVIAREWEYLVPVRAFCEAHEVPVQMANEEIPKFWRLRETRAFVEWLRGRETRIVDGTSLRGWADARPSDPWHDLLRQAVVEHELETGGGETPIDHFIEWLAEWGRDIRRRQRGLLLLTAHRAKGLEFDHVAVLDGGWDRVGRDEDPDAPRRLYYVAMTRARQTLTLARLHGSRSFLAELADHPATIRREAADLPPCLEAVEYRHVRPTLQDVDLGFAGRRRAGDPLHGAIATLSIGDPLQVRVGTDGRWTLRDRVGRTVGRLAGSFRPPAGARCRSAEVFSVVGWSREASDPKYRDAMKCDAWEVVVPELVFEPDR